MTNLEGRVILRQQRAHAARRACAATWRCSPGWPSGSARRCPSPTDPEAVFDELRRATAGGIADYSGITYERIHAEQGVFWPCPTAEHPARRGCSRPLRPPRRPGPVPRRRAPRRGRAAVRGLPGLPDHRPGARAVPVRRPDPPGPRAARRRAVRRAAPDPRRPARHRRRRRRCAVATRRGDDDRPRPAGRRRSGRTPSSCRSTGSAPTGSPTTRSTRPAGCRSSRCAPPRAVRPCLSGRQRVVVVGNGMAAARLAEEPRRGRRRRHGPRRRAHAPYNRILLSARARGDPRAPTR